MKTKPAATQASFVYLYDFKKLPPEGTKRVFFFKDINKNNDSFQFVIKGIWVQAQAQDKSYISSENLLKLYFSMKEIAIRIGERVYYLPVVLHESIIQLKAYGSFGESPEGHFCGHSVEYPKIEPRDQYPCPNNVSISLVWKDRFVYSPKSFDGSILIGLFLAGIQRRLRRGELAKRLEKENSHLLWLPVKEQ